MTALVNHKIRTVFGIFADVDDNYGLVDAAGVACLPRDQAC